jgi:single-strand DNA-binding protein
MAGNMNVAMISGHLGRDPEIRTGPSGKPIGNLSVASGEWWTKDGEKKERTEWFAVVCFNEVTCRYIESSLRKGDYVRVMGRIRTRKWQDQSGQDRYSTEVVIEPFFGELEKIGSREGGGNRPPAASSPDDYGNARTSSRQPAPAAASDPFDDEIPF